MKIIIDDTKHLVGMFGNGQLHHCRKNGVTFHVTQYSIMRITDIEHLRFINTLLANELLVLDAFSGNELERLNAEIADDNNEYGLSDSDYSLILLSQRMSSKLFTTDCKLINCAIRYNVEIVNEKEIDNIINNIM